MIEIAVVTKVPSAEDGGNLAVAGFDLFWATGEKDEHYLDKVVPLIDGLTTLFGGDGRMAASMLLSMRQPVFQLGEIMFLGPDEREVLYPGRKPSKWFIEIETCETIEEAVALSQRVTKEAREASNQTEEV